VHVARSWDRVRGGFGPSGGCWLLYLICHRATASLAGVSSNHGRALPSRRHRSRMMYGDTCGAPTTRMEHGTRGTTRLSNIRPQSHTHAPDHNHTHIWERTHSHSILIKLAITHTSTCMHYSGIAQLPGTIGCRRNRSSSLGHRRGLQHTPTRFKLQQECLEALGLRFYWYAFRGFASVALLLYRATLL
jgi:hypothetical protein